jgi:hypothetical protein
MHAMDNGIAYFSRAVSYMRKFFMIYTGVHAKKRFFFVSYSVGTNKLENLYLASFLGESNIYK